MTDTRPTIMYGTAWKEDRTAECARQALAAGFRAIDTANQRRHYFEAGVGEAVHELLGSGKVPRDLLFLQTKFTYVRGQDHRLPYDPDAPLTRQVEQSMASSLEHLRVTYVDSYVLHGPSHGAGWSKDDQEVWEAMVGLRDAGKTRALGVSNVSRRHLDDLAAAGGAMPAYVQNRCYARMGWDRPVREFCKERNIAYQGFSLLTANPEVLSSRKTAAIAQRVGGTVAQVVFRFSQQVGMLPLTGTTDPAHMKEDLACESFTLTEDEVAALESLAG